MAISRPTGFAIKFGPVEAPPGGCGELGGMGGALGMNGPTGSESRAAAA